MLAGKFQQALKDLETVARTHPNDKDAQDKFKKCQQVVRRQAFEKAIASDKPEAPTDSEEVANADQIALEADYSGPRFSVVEGEPQLSLDFVKQLLETYKAQKKLHRKFAIQVSLQILFILFMMTIAFPNLQIQVLVCIHISWKCRNSDAFHYTKDNVLYIRVNTRLSSCKLFDVNSGQFYSQMVKRVRDYLKAMPSLVEIKVPAGQKFTICGDIHGQFYDLVCYFVYTTVFEMHSSNFNRRRTPFYCTGQKIFSNLFARICCGLGSIEFCNILCTNYVP